MRITRLYLYGPILLLILETAFEHLELDCVCLEAIMTTGNAISSLTVRRGREYR